VRTFWITFFAKVRFDEEDAYCTNAALLTSASVSRLLTSLQSPLHLPLSLPFGEGLAFVVELLASGQSYLHLGPVTLDIEA
jgi:hypothetical protein